MKSIFKNFIHQDSLFFQIRIENPVIFLSLILCVFFSAPLQASQMAKTSETVISQASFSKKEVKQKIKEIRKLKREIRSGMPDGIYLILLGILLGAVGLIGLIVSLIAGAGSTTFWVLGGLLALIGHYS